MINLQVSDSIIRRVLNVNFVFCVLNIRGQEQNVLIKNKVHLNFQRVRFFSFLTFAVFENFNFLLDLSLSLEM